MDLPLKVEASSRVRSWLCLGEDLDEANVIEVAAALDDWHSVDEFLHDDMVVSAEDNVHIGDSIGEIAILVVPHVSKGDDYIASEVILEMRCSPFRKLTPIFIIQLALVLVRKDADPIFASHSENTDL